MKILFGCWMILANRKNYRQFLIHQNLTANICLRNRYCHAILVPNRLFDIDRKLVNHKVCLSIFYNEPLVDINIVMFIRIELFPLYLSIDYISFIIKLRYVWYNQGIVVCQDFLFTLGLSTPTVTRVKIDNIWHTHDAVT